MNEERILMTVGIPVNEKTLYLARKQRGKGEGLLNGFGGSFEPEKDRTLDDCLDREGLEEWEIKVLDKEKLGIVEFRFIGKNYVIEMHIYRVNRYEGTPTDVPGQDSRDPKEYDLKELPYKRMWAGDRIWFPMFLGRKKFRGKVLYEDPLNIREHDIVEVESL